jgi:uncharacterized protein YutE (UPF0331/DUF86 family)
MDQAAYYLHHGDTQAMDQRYLDSVGEHIAGCIAELDEAAEKAARLSLLERRGVERLFQLVVESAIRLARQWCQIKQGVTPKDAYHSFELLRGQGVISTRQEAGLRKLAGLRNLLALDYLKIDPRTIVSVLERGEYRLTQEFYERIRDDQGPAESGKVR